MEYIATFFTHFDALQFSRKLESLGLKGKMSPVPRRLSSSCGTCVKFNYDGENVENIIIEEVEQLAKVNGKDFDLIIDNR